MKIIYFHPRAFHIIIIIAKASNSQRIDGLFSYLFYMLMNRSLIKFGVPIRDLLMLAS
jgi:hypothetical protein